MSEKAVLKKINTMLDYMGINYFYHVNDSAIVEYPYVVGEYHETGYSFEDNRTSGEMLLNAWTRGSEETLISIKDIIKANFQNYQTIIDEGTFNTGLAVNYVSNYTRYTGEEDLKRVEIKLDIEYWESE